MGLLSGLYSLLVGGSENPNNANPTDTGSPKQIGELKGIEKVRSTEVFLFSKPYYRGHCASESTSWKEKALKVLHFAISAFLSIVDLVTFPERCFIAGVYFCVSKTFDGIDWVKEKICSLWGKVLAKKEEDLKSVPQS